MLKACSLPRSENARRIVDYGEREEAELPQGLERPLFGMRKVYRSGTV